MLDAAISPLPGSAVSDFAFKPRYDNFINGKFTAPLSGQYFDNVSPITGRVFTQAARSTEADVNLALDAAHAAAEAWGRRPAAERAGMLLKIADRMEQNLDLLAYVETVDNGKPIRETTAADVPLAIDHLRYFASCVRAQEGALSEIDHDTVAYHFHEPLGVVGQIIPWNFPLLMAIWKLAPALAAGNCVVLKPAEQTPISIMVLMELVGDLLPPGVINVVNGFGLEAGKPLASSSRIAKIAFTGETTTGRLIMQYASHNLIPVTLELGGKSPNIFFSDVMAEDDDFLDKAIEGLVMFALNQGEVCTCPSRAFVQESVFDKFMEKALKRVAAIKQGSPLDPATMIGAQASSEQMQKIMSYIDIGQQEGAKMLIGGGKADLGGALSSGFYINPTVFHGHNKMRIFQEEIFGPVLSVTTFKTEEEVLGLANDTLYGLGAGVWSRDGNRAYRMGRGIKAGRVWTNCYHLYPAHAAFGGYKQSGIGRETHKMMLDHYQQTKNLLVSYSAKPLGFFLMNEAPARVLATEAALELMARLQAEHGKIMFHQSGGCCDGSSPMCYPVGDYLVAPDDVKLGEIGGADFFMSRGQFEYWRYTQLIIDVVEGMGGMFSLENGTGLRFLTRSRLFSEAELAVL